MAIPPRLVLRCATFLCAFALSACSDDVGTPASDAARPLLVEDATSGPTDGGEAVDAANGPRTSDAEDARVVDAATSPGDGEDCDGGTIIGEFGDCVWVTEIDPPDAGAERDAAEPDADAPAGEPDAHVPLDAGAQEPVCGDAPSACASEPVHPLQANAACTLMPDRRIEVSFGVCQDCGTERTTFGAGLVFRACGGCEQLYATRGETGMRALQDGACVNVRYRSPRALANTAVSGSTCVDVYASTQSTIRDDFSGALYRDEQLAHVCRCNDVTGECVSCAHGGCVTE